MYTTQHKTDQEKRESLIPSNLFYPHLNLLPLPLILPPILFYHSLSTQMQVCGVGRCARLVPMQCVLCYL